MRVVLFTQDEPIYMPRYLEPLFEVHADLIKEVILAPNTEPFTETVMDRYEMFGPRAFLIYGILYLKNKLLSGFPADWVHSLRGRYYSVRALASSYNVPVKTVRDINSKEYITHLISLKPDLILSIACEQKLGEKLLEIPKLGCVNIHGSLLPEYRGRMTAFWVLYHGEDESGVTAHYMTPKFDAGDILLQRKYQIEPDDTMHDVYLKLIETGSEVAIEVIDEIRAGDVETKPNRTEDGEYYSRPTSEHRDEFLRRGNRFI